MRIFCMIVFSVALLLRIVAFAMDNAAEAAPSTPVNQIALHAVR